MDKIVSFLGKYNHRTENSYQISMCVAKSPERLIIVLEVVSSCQPPNIHYNMSRWLIA